MQTEWIKDNGKWYYLSADYASTITVDLSSKRVSLSQSQLDSFISFAYNCGMTTLLGSSLYKNIIEGVGDSDIITSNF